MGAGDIPEGQNCDWCSESATGSFELKRRVRGGKAGATWPTGQYYYACEDHYEQAKRITSDPAPSLGGSGRRKK